MTGRCRPLLEARGVENNGHGQTREEGCDGNRHDPRQEEQADSLPVDCLESSVHQTNTNGGTSDAHGGTDWQLVLREDQDGNGSAQLHRGASRRAVVSDLVTHDTHDVVSVGHETHHEDQCKNSDLPQRDGLLGLRGVAGVPGTVDDRPRSHCVSNIVGAVGKGGGASGDELDERVGVLDFVRVLGRVGVHSLHSVALWGALETGLCCVDVVVHSVESCDDKHSRHSLQHALHVVGLVNGTWSHGVLVEVSHRPAERARLLSKSRVKALSGFAFQFLVCLVNTNLLNLRDRKLLIVDSARGLGLISVVLNNAVVRHLGNGSLCLGGVRSRPQERTLDDFPRLETLVTLDDLGVEPWNEEDS